MNEPQYTQTVFLFIVYILTYIRIRHSMYFYDNPQVQRHWMCCALYTVVEHVIYKHMLSTVFIYTRTLQNCSIIYFLYYRSFAWCIPCRYVLTISEILVVAVPQRYHKCAWKRCGQSYCLLLLVVFCSFRSFNSAFTPCH